MPQVRFVSCQLKLVQRELLFGDGDVGLLAGSAHRVDHGDMRSPRGSRLARLALAGLFALALVGVAGSSRGTPAAAASHWTGGVDLYRSGAFTTQQTWLWCTAADVQIIRNIVDHRADHTRSGQQLEFDYMRARNRYRIPVSDGVDPAGWTAGLRHFVDDRYRLTASSSFDSALRSAVTNLRMTNLPVGITVSRGNHAWILTGFTATADPAVTTHFTVTSVRVVGPLWGLQSRTYGYDMRPDRTLTPSQLKGFFTPWHYARIKMAWEGRWVSVQPVVKASSAATGSAPKATPTTKTTSTPKATRTSMATPIPMTVSTPTIEPTSSLGPAGAGIVPLAAPEASATPGPGPGETSQAPTADAAAAVLSGGLLVLGLAGLAVVGRSARRARFPR